MEHFHAHTVDPFTHVPGLVSCAKNTVMHGIHLLPTRSSQSGEGGGAVSRKHSTISSLKAPGVVEAPGTGSHTRLGGYRSETMEGFLEEETPELGVNQVERGRRENQMHEP